MSYFRSELYRVIRPHVDKFGNKTRRTIQGNITETSIPLSEREENIPKCTD